MRRILARRWIALGTVAAGCALLAALGVVGSRPFPLESRTVESQLSALLGGSSRIEGATWRWIPEPMLVLLEPRFERTFGPVGKLHVAARRAEVTGLDLFAADSSPLVLPDGIELRDLRLGLGPLRLVHGYVSVARSGSGLQLRGHALGVSGGRADLSARVEEGSWESASGQLYLENLETSLSSSASVLDPSLGDRAESFGERALRLNGVVSASRAGDSSQRFDVHLEVLGVHANRPGSWLSATLEGALEHSPAGWSREGHLDLVGQLGIVTGQHRIRALKSRARGTLRIAGDPGSERAELDLRLSDVGGRIDGWIDARKLGSGRLRATTRLRDAGVEGTLDLGRFQLNLRRDGQGTWRVRSEWLGLSELRPLLPALETLPMGTRGQARFAASFDAARGWTGEIEAREIAIPVRDAQGELISNIRMSSARMRIQRDTLELDLPDLRIGGEALNLRVQGELSGGRPIVAVAGSAASLDLRRVARVLAALFGTPDTDLTLEAALAPLVQALRRHPSLLSQLIVRPSILHVQKLQGLGLDAQNAAIRIALRHQLLEIGYREAEGGKLDLAVRVDLEGWVPRVLGQHPVDDPDRPLAPGA